MPFAHLTLRSVEARAVLVPLKRPIVSKVGRYEAWPLILIDLHTEEGVVGRSYLEPYLERSVRYLVPAILDLAAAREGRPVVPLDDFRQGRSSLGLVGLEGMSLIAVSGLDMAAWDALAKAAGMPLAAFLGGSLAPVPAYNSNGLWLTAPERLGEEAAGLVAEGGFGALKLRLGRERLADDLAAIRAVRAAAGGEVRLMADFNQGLSLGDALRRCRELDDQGLYWLEEPIAYDDLAGYARLTRELATPVQLGENFYGPRALLGRPPGRGRRLRHARPDADRRGERLAARGRARRRGGDRGVEPPLPRVLGAPAAGDRDRALARVAGLGRPGPGRAVPARAGAPGHPRPAGRRPGVGRGRRPAVPPGPVTDGRPPRLGGTPSDGAHAVEQVQRIIAGLPRLGAAARTRSRRAAAMAASPHIRSGAIARTTIPRLRGHRARVGRDRPFSRRVSAMGRPGTEVGAAPAAPGLTRAASTPPARLQSIPAGNPHVRWPARLRLRRAMIPDRDC